MAESIDCNGQERTELGKHYKKSDGGGGASQYEWKKLCRPFQAVKNMSFYPSFKPSVTESKVAHQLLLNGKIGNKYVKFILDGKKHSERLGFQKLSTTKCWKPAYQA